MRLFWIFFIQSDFGLIFNVLLYLKCNVLILDYQDYNKCFFKLRLKQWSLDIKMFHIYKSILILQFLVTFIQAIQWVRVGFQHNNVLPKTEILNTSDQSYCTIHSFYNATTNKYGDAGVTFGSMCDYVFDKGLKITQWVSFLQNCERSEL